MKQKSIIWLMAGLLMLLLAGCGEDSQTTRDGRVQIDYWVLFGGGDLDFMQEIVDDYNESQDDVYVNVVLQDYDEYYTKLTTSVVADRGPDVAVSHAAVLPDLVNQGLTMPLDSIAEEAGLDWETYNENIVDSIEVEGERHAVPLDTHPMIMYFNTDLAEEAGMVDENGELLLEEESPESFLEFLGRPNDEGMEASPIALSTGGADAYRLWWAFYHQMGGTPIFDAEDLNDVKVSLDKETAVEAVKYLKSFYYEEELIPLNSADFFQDFQSERTVGIMTGVWGTGTFEATDLNIQAYPIPSVFGEKAAWGDSHTLIMPIKDDTNTERQQASMDFIEYVTTQGGLTWTEAGHIPADNETVESDEFNAMPNRSEYAEVADYVEYPPKTIYYRPAETEMTRSIDEILADRVSPEQGIDDMVNELEAIVN
ncbi:extracellular solute-binding protein [Alteribacillus sp. HJP-4]|uniref:extracellular solute-binding protein n=1 Tax=Alteribacillus sp. HJP-4 TaxID=2775394 RepID=UPI0035CD1378